MRYVVADVFSEQHGGRFDFVYADPPYANCRARYARANNCRQWGRDARADFMRDLIAVMKRAVAPGGACAVSMSSPELRLLPLFPSGARVLPWVKHTRSPLTKYGPRYAWEPIVAWGSLPTNGKLDWFEAKPARPTKAHEAPKPVEFADFLLDVLVPNGGHTFLELFAGTATISARVEERGMLATAVDIRDPVSKEATC